MNAAKVKCPNCLLELDAENPAHTNGCMIGAMLGVAVERGHDLSKVDVNKIWVDALWEEYLDGAVTQMLWYLDLPSYPEDGE